MKPVRSLGILLLIICVVFIGCTSQQIEKTHGAIQEAQSTLRTLESQAATFELAADSAFAIYQSARDPKDRADAEANYVEAKAKVKAIESQILTKQSILQRLNDDYGRLTDPNISDIERGSEAAKSATKAYRDAGLPYGDLIFMLTTVVGGVTTAVYRSIAKNKDRQATEIVTGIHHGKDPVGTTVDLSKSDVRAAMSPDTQAFVRGVNKQLAA